MGERAGVFDLQRELEALSEIPILGKPYVNSAFATGSLLAGFGTPTSDFDVIVLVRGESDKERAKQDGALRRHGSVRADVEVFTLDEFAGAIADCADFSKAWRTARIYRIAAAVRLLSQFTAAALVLKSSAELADFSDRIAAQRAELMRISVMRSVIYGNNAQEDLIGLIEAGDEVGTLRRSHGYLDFGIDAWCTSRGSIYPDDKFKWLWRRLNLVLSSEPELAALRALHVPETVTEPIPGVASRRRDTAQALLAQAVLAAWALNPGAFAVPVLPAWDGPGRPDETLRRSANWMPTRTSEAWGVGASYRYYQVPTTGAIAWACASGRTRAELEEIVAVKYRAGFGGNATGAEIHRTVSQLLDIGAIGVAGPAATSRARTA